MLHEVKLIFGYDNYSGDIAVSPEEMLSFLRRPFSDWLYSKSWNGKKIGGWEESDFHRHIYESTEHYNDCDFFFDLKSAHWRGFRISLSQNDSEVEFVFTTNVINGEIRISTDCFAKNITGKLLNAKSYLNQVLSEVKRD